MTLYPLIFQPIFKDRVWGGRRLETLYGKKLPPAIPVGESWEVSDRPGDLSVVVNGPLAGKDLHWLIEHYRTALVGHSSLHHGRFPLLIKILDAREKLSLQVHPPAQKARELGGEPKTELWYIADADPGAELFVGLKQGITRAEFEKRIAAGDIEKCFHRIPVKSGDAMFLPSGRVHAIGAGLVIFEIQQNSDTTYRVFDWNRVGLDGKPRELHLRQSLESIDFTDFEPALVPPASPQPSAISIRPLVRDPLFKVSACRLPAKTQIALPAGEMRILGVTSGAAEVHCSSFVQHLGPGTFCLVPAGLARECILLTDTGAEYLETLA